MAAVKFISQEYLRENSVINDNADWELIVPAIYLVQDTYVERVLGTALMNDLKTKIIADNTLAAYPNEKGLLNDYIKPMMLWYILMEASPLFKFRYENKGIMTKSSDNSQPADTQDVRYIMDKWRINAEMYAERTTKYLYYNQTLFPAYSVIIPGEKRHSYSNYSTGIDLDDRWWKVDPRPRNAWNDPRIDFGY